MAPLCIFPWKHDFVKEGLPQCLLDTGLDLPPHKEMKITILLMFSDQNGLLKVSAHVQWLFKRKALVISAFQLPLSGCHLCLPRRSMAVAWLQLAQWLASIYRFRGHFLFDWKIPSLWSLEGVMLTQWFSNRGDFAPQGPLGNIWSYLGLSQLEEGATGI